MTRSSRIPALAAVASALAHGALLLTLFPFERQLLKYPLAAADRLAGILPPERISDFSPFYLGLNVVVGALAGPAAGSGGVASIVALQILALALTAALLSILLLQLLPRWAATLGAAAFVLSTSVVAYAGVLEPEPFLLFFVVAFLFLVSLERPRPLAAGVALALALSVRPSVLPLVAALPAFFLVRTPKGGPWVRATALALAPSIALLAVLSLRNGAATGRFTPLGMNPGFVFYEGNNPLSSGRSAIYPPLVGELIFELAGVPDAPHQGYRMVAARSGVAGSHAPDANRYWRERALAFATDHPRAFLALLATRAGSLLRHERSHDVLPAQRFDSRLEERRIPTVPFPALVALAVIGMVASSHDWRRLLPFHVLVAGQTCVMLAFYVSERQRLLLVPALVVFAGLGLNHLAHSSWRARALAGSVGVLYLALALAPGDRAADRRHVWDAYEAREAVWAPAFALRDRGRIAEAEQAAALAYAATPWLEDYSRPSGLAFAPEGFAARALATVPEALEDPSRRLDRARLLAAAGHLDEAAVLLRNLIDEERRFDRGFLQSSEPRYHLARVEAARGERATAVALLVEALARAPGDPFVLAQLAALTGDDLHRRAIARYFSPLDAALLVGLAELEHRAGDHGVAALTEVTRSLPELWRAQVYLAAALSASGNPEAARSVFWQAMAERDDPVLLEEWIVPMMAAAAARAPDDPTARFEYGLVLAQFGRFDEALAELRASFATDPRPETERAIASVERWREGGPR